MPRRADCVGLTPTRVGTTPRPSGAAGTRRAHPHTRGDDTARPDSAREGGGSPPHAWGRPWTLGGAYLTGRLTPTRVGTTLLDQVPATITRAHPHTRGDDHCSIILPTASTGSPPHAWGRQILFSIVITNAGLTPTRVGTTGCFRPSGTATGAHPHTRGDDVVAGPAGCQPRGSPPHAWGRPVPDDVPSQSDGLTPTRVGTTISNVTL